MFFHLSEIPFSFRDSTHSLKSGPMAICRKHYLIILKQNWSLSALETYIISPPVLILRDISLADSYCSYLCTRAKKKNPFQFLRAKIRSFESLADSWHV